ncbi:E3 ubiquitin-protein ligase HAKAI homolog isoform X2 [Punica granatum]|uniref:RING-type E3 ubiquitin transferase n=2 Tax=Punica granatum TaxID=22663 RepID=A0A6P8E6B0_PUNGR|nr:E3 ubiquitin-protein ligase HAKAI homolog isoform X2 [Punica granatum]
MLQIRLKRDPSSDAGGGGKPLPTETVTVACPDHLVLADLPVAKGLGAATCASVVKVVGRKSRRQLGERVHFCVRCDFPIAIYGRLSPCEHAFCLDCARSDSICYLCDERIQKIQTIKMMEGIFICAAPHCLKSFMKKSEFEIHIHESHTDLLNPNAEKEEAHESEAWILRQPSASESTARAPPRPGFSPGPLQLPDREDKARNIQSREQQTPRPPLQQKPPAYTGQANNPSESQTDGQHPPGFDQPNLHSLPQEPGQYPPLNPIPQPNFMMPLPSTPMLNHPPPFGFPPFQPEGAPQAFFNGPYEVARQDSNSEAGPEQGSLLGFPPGAMNFPPGYAPTWNAGIAGSHFETQGSVQGAGDGYQNQGDYMRNHPGALPLNPLPVPPNMPGGGSADVRDGRGVLAPQPPSFPPPPPSQSQPHLPQNKRGKFYSGDGQGFGWQHENRDSFGSNQD